MTFDTHVLRGGNHHSPPDNCRSTYRNWLSTVVISRDVGFRVCSPVDETRPPQPAVLRGGGTWWDDCSDLSRSAFRGYEDRLRLHARNIGFRVCCPAEEVESEPRPEPTVWTNGRSWWGDRPDISRPPFRFRFPRQLPSEGKSSDLQVLRGGGGLHSSYEHRRSAVRYGSHPVGRALDVGFRVCSPAEEVRPRAKAAVLRGGSWFYHLAQCRVAFRILHQPDNRNRSIGFRVSCPTNI